ncbi:OLC1v1031517C1 [Oldenlandia corymbosa var. corymbosa]|uniref:OLC1v1031517C1 n=1 Tax=Oldenlandia corymbosa var. corymbosa TaxID=529605 RepID=A0AAV1CJG1_OLDCO|nr:OLC1v1031517C1 [Oldenlandia corymbosa var. corymbosa]
MARLAKGKKVVTKPPQKDAGLDLASVKEAESCSQSNGKEVDLGHHTLESSASLEAKTALETVKYTKPNSMQSKDKGQDTGMLMKIGQSNAGFPKAGEYNGNPVEDYSKNGGRLLMWRKGEIDVDILENDEQYIHCMVKDQVYKRRFKMTLVYGANGKNERWNALIRIVKSIMCQEEKIGGLPVTAADVGEFQMVIDECQLW